MKILIANSNSIHAVIENKCKSEWNAPIIKSPADLNDSFLSEYKPDFIFFLHWSHIISDNIWKNYKCVVFHMTDLPFGRGGSPLQNLIVNGYTKTVISAIKVEAGIDTGDVYCKKELSLHGTAEEIFLRAGETIFEMIKVIVHDNPSPIPQVGTPTNFKRRTPSQGDIKKLATLQEIYDYIRMLDAEGYPPAFLETENFKFEFKRASLKKDSIIADVRIFKK